MDSPFASRSPAFDAGPPPAACPLLDAIAFAHPAINRIGISQEGAHWRASVVKPRRCGDLVVHARILPGEWEALDDELARALPTESAQARSIARILALAGPWERLGPSRRWASRQWGPNGQGQGGLDQDSEEGLRVFESSCAQALAQFPEAVFACAHAGARWLSGWLDSRPRLSCEAMRAKALASQERLALGAACAACEPQRVSGARL